MEGFEVKSMLEACKEADILVTATGNKDIITGAHFEAMKIRLSFVTLVTSIMRLTLHGSIRTMDTKDEIKPQVDKYTINGSDVILLAEGRLVNLGCATGHPSFVMSNSFTNQVLAQIEFGSALNQYENKVYTLPKHLDEKVARLHLEKIGVVLEVLTQDQADYIGVPVNGPYKSNEYRY